MNTNLICIMYAIHREKEGGNTKTGWLRFREINSTEPHASFDYALSFNIIYAWP